MTTTRVVLASVATGLLGALGLTLVAFPGTSEHTITGTALLAFGAGWAALAALSRRWTDQPQQWARVPAAVLSITGLALLVTTPGQHAVTVAGWVWPPALLALAVWCVVQLRSAMTG